MTEDVSVALIRAIVDAMSDPTEGVPDSWESFTLVLGIRDNAEVSESYGYAYAPGQIVAISPWPSDLDPAVAPYLASYFKPGEQLPVKLLVQFDRTSGRYEITFEDTDSSRWQVSPANIDTIREELRPRFDA